MTISFVTICKISNNTKMGLEFEKKRKIKRLYLVMIIPKLFEMRAS